MRKSQKRKKRERVEIDHAKVKRLRQQLEHGQLGVDFSKLIDGLAHAMKDKHPNQL